MKQSQEFMEFLYHSPSVFHAVENIRQYLVKGGYTELFEENKWNLQHDGKYFVVRGEASILAFQMNVCKDLSFNITAAHSDAPHFKLKPNSELLREDQYVQLNTEPYGGVLMSTWFDRPLSLAGRVIVRKGKQFESVLCNIDRDLLMIPSLAIHYNREANQGMTLNAQQHLLPIMALGTEKEFYIRKLLAGALRVEEAEIAYYDLNLYPRQKACIWGYNEEFVSAYHLDDLACAYALLKAFIDSRNKEAVNVFCCFDHEEIGSASKQGAASTFLIDVLERIHQSSGIGTLEEALASSMIVSADNAHAKHPNYPEKNDPGNSVSMNGGVVIKHNANQAYTTDAMSASLFRNFCELAEVSCQDYSNRSDLRGGGTLGSISSTQVSILSVDVGLAQLAMHSAYETMGVKDVEDLIKVLKVFYSHKIKKQKNTFEIS